MTALFSGEPMRISWPMVSAPLHRLHRLTASLMCPPPTPPHPLHAFIMTMAAQDPHSYCLLTIAFLQHGLGRVVEKDTPMPRGHL